MPLTVSLQRHKGVSDGVARQVSTLIGSAADRIDEVCKVVQLPVGIAGRGYDLTIVLCSRPEPLPDHLLERELIVLFDNPASQHLPGGTAYYLRGPNMRTRSPFFDPAGLTDAISMALLTWCPGGVLRTQWTGSSEVLVERVRRLLERRAELSDLLSAAYRDLDVAETRIAELEHMVDILEHERRGAKDHALPMVIATIAVAIATFLGPVVAGRDDANVASSELVNEVQNTIEAAARTFRDCGNIAVQIPPGIVSPDRSRRLVCW